MTLSEACQATRRFLARFLNKETLIFLFFLFISAIFWLILTLNEQTEQEVRVPIRIVGVPKDVVLTSDEVDTIRATVRDRGLLVAAFYYGQPKTVSIRFDSYDKSNGRGVVSAADLKKLLAQAFPSSTAITAVKPDHYTYYYNYGLSRKLPVRWVGMAIPESMYFLARTQIEPDSVVVYAPKEKLDSLTHISTVAINRTEFRDTLRVNARLDKQAGVKCVPAEVTLTFYTDVLTEETVENVPVIGVNLPEGKVLRTFPGRVSISIVGGVSLVRTLKPEDFIVTADYRDIEQHPTDKCQLTLKSAPQGLSKARLQTQSVDYLIEDEKP